MSSDEPALPPSLVRQLQRAGRSIIPFSASKTPLIKWAPYQAERASLLDLVHWQVEYEPACWAMVTGEISNLVVLDFDGESGRRTMEALGLDPHVSTPGGAHVFIDHPGGHVITRAPLDPERWRGMDTRGDGGCAIFHGPGYTYHAHEPLPWSSLPAELVDALQRRDAPAATPTGAVIHEGGRHAHLVGLAGTMVARGADGAAVEAAVVAENANACDPPMPEDDVRHLARDVTTRYRTSRRYAPTDLGNAERLADLSGQELRHVIGIGWYVWDGRRWKRDDGEVEVRRRAMAAARSQYSALADDDPEDNRATRRRAAAQSESRRGIEAAINLAAALPGIAISADSLNSDPWLLNALNGTIDLRTGTLRLHDPDDLITKLAPVAYEPDARSTRWESFLERATGGDREVLEFVRRLAGYTATGSIAEEILVFLHGPGSTGKTTCVKATSMVLGDYAMTADFETFLVRRGVGGIRNDVARLAGARLVVSVEVDDGATLAEGLIKALTGGDTVTARYLYREAFEFTPRFTLWLVANARPRARADDDALWRRIVQVPFNVVIPPEERDPELKHALCTDPAEQTAILAWLVQGCLDWQRQGLAIPECVRAYTQDYRSENDPLGRWLSDSCRLDPSGEIRAQALFASLESWWRQNADGPAPSKMALAKRLKEFGCTNEARRDARWWRGIGLRDDCDDCDDCSTNSPSARAYGEVIEPAVTPVTPVTDINPAPSSPHAQGDRSAEETHHVG